MNEKIDQNLSNDLLENISFITIPEIVYRNMENGSYIKMKGEVIEELIIEILADFDTEIFREIIDFYGY